MHYRDVHPVASDGLHQLATQDYVHQTPDLNQNHIKHNLAIFHIDLRYVSVVILPL